jgi:DNA-binding XRE family transcriptional regulator
MQQSLPIEVNDAITQLGKRIRVARTRRKITQQALAAACGITRKTIYVLETGGAGATLGNAADVLWVLGLLETLRAVADPDADAHGKTLEAARRSRRVRAERATPDLNHDF